MVFDIIALEQGSLDWLKWRAEGIGASDAPAIMHENPWKSAGELQQEKLFPRFDRPINAAMARGTALEPAARALYSERRGLDVAPACIQSRALPWMRASLDGICFDRDIVVEIKCGESVYKRSSRNGVPPDYYYGQLQHILAVCGYAAIDFWCYLPGKQPILIEIPRDQLYIDRLIERERIFWDRVGANASAALTAPGNPTPRKP